MNADGSASRSKISARGRRFLAIGFSVWLPAVALARQSGAAESSVLEMGAAVVREIVGGEAQFLRIPMGQSQYARVVVNQNTADVALTLRSPSGQVLAHVDAPSGERSPERVSLVAQVPGDYVLEVRSNQKDARKRRYEARLEVLRQAAPSDSDRIGAERLFFEAERLRGEGGGVSLRRRDRRIRIVGAQVACRG